MPVSPSTPVVLRFTTSRGEVDYVAARRRDDYFGGQVLFQFKSPAQYQLAKEQVLQRLYPLCSSSAFQALAKRMFGADAKIVRSQHPGVALTRAQLEKLTDVAFVQRHIDAQKKAGGDAPFMPAKAIARMARFVTRETDANGRSLFDVIDRRTGPKSSEPSRNGRLEVRDAIALFSSTTAQQREHVPAIVTGRLGGKVRTFLARDSWDFNATRRVEFGSVEAYRTFQRQLRNQIAPLFSSKDFPKVLAQLVGPRAVAPELGGAALSWSDLWKLRDPARVEEALRTTGASLFDGAQDPAQAAQRVAKIALYLTSTAIDGQQAPFSALTLGHATGGARLTTRDVMSLLRNTDLARS